MQHFESAHYGCINHCHYPATREGRGPHGGREQDCPDGKISALYTGDLNIKKSVTAAVKTFLGDDRWRRIRFLQVPHHGSKKSWENGQSTMWNHEWSVFSAGLNNRYKHPHQEVLDDLKLHNPVLVNQWQGAAWGGMAGWANS
jgi:beta-lactamase superfamily II metal-dependent hydrolase